MLRVFLPVLQCGPKMKESLSYPPYGGITAHTAVCQPLLSKPLLCPSTGTHESFAFCTAGADNHPRSARRWAGRSLFWTTSMSTPTLAPSEAPPELHADHSSAAGDCAVPELSGYVFEPLRQDGEFL